MIGPLSGTPQCVLLNSSEADTTARYGGYERADRHDKGFSGI